MRGLKRKICDSLPCRNSLPFFRPLLRPDGPDSAFFQAPLKQRLSPEKLGEYKPFADWYEPKLEHLKYALWDPVLRQDRAALLAYLGLNLGTSASAFTPNPQVPAENPKVNSPEE